MWLFNTLRKLVRGPQVGQTFRDYIGCYVLVEEVDGYTPDYRAMPTNLQALQSDVQAYLHSLLQAPATLQADAAAIHSTLPQLANLLQAHTSSDMKQAFLTLSDRKVFVHTGVRERRKENGKFVE